ncbi:hypothetical protein BC829DRAFT_387008 [Chytridium lagenaria]|nr:hypothetical protein BC829DRAFT_387008 [Chytridium lagenaria]
MTTPSPVPALNAFLRADDVEDILDAFKNWKDACVTSSTSATNLARPYDTYVLLRDSSRYATHHLSNFWKCMDRRFEDPSPLSTLGGNTASTTASSGSNHNSPRLTARSLVKKRSSGDLLAARSVSPNPLGKSDSAAGGLSAEESNLRVMVVGAGPAGLFAAVRACILKPESCVVLEKRNTYGRYNVMRIHKSEMDELVQMFAARDFYSQLAVGQFDSVPIRRLQIILTKIALILGANIYSSSTLVSVQPSTEPKSTDWTATVKVELDSYTFPRENNLAPLPSPPPAINFNTLIIASGVTSSQIGTTTSPGTSSAEAYTTTGDVKQPTISRQSSRTQVTGGIVQYCLPQFFASLRKTHGIDLENVATYPGDKGDTYIVMTPRKACLLNFGVLKEDRKESADIVKSDNVCREKLLEFARIVATEVGIPEDWTFRQRPSRTRESLRCMVRAEDSATSSTTVVSSDPSIPQILEPEHATPKVRMVDDVAVFDFSTRTVARFPCKTVFGDRVVYPAVPGNFAGPPSPPRSPNLKASSSPPHSPSTTEKSSNLPSPPTSEPPSHSSTEPSAPQDFSTTPTPHRLFVTLVGDSLVVPFWPLGTGWACAANSTAWAIEAVRTLGGRVETWDESCAEEAMKNHMEMFLTKKGQFAH